METSAKLKANSNLYLGLLMLFATLMIYILGKDNIMSHNSSTWYILLAISAILSIYLSSRKTKK